VEKARELAASADRSSVADVYIGHMLAHAPQDAVDSAWPHRVVRDLIEKVKSADLERGIQVARLNMKRGGFIDPKDPGADERHLAEQARVWARSAAAWPRTNAMLSKLVQTWESSATHWEEHFRQEEMRPD
jgi:hypothetical protein